MKYIRNRMNYFRQGGARIEDTKEFRAAVKEQNDNEPIPSEEVPARIGIILLSLFVVIVLILIIIFGVRYINSMESADDIFENIAVLWCIFGIFCLIGLLFTGIPIVNGFRLKLKCTEEAQAACIGYDDITVTNKHGAHFESCPVYKFNEAGAEYTVYDQKYTRYTTKLPAIGSVVQIKFDPDDPNRCIIDNKVNWKIPAIIIGVFFLFLAVVFYLGAIQGVI